ncbi:hypothetical protein [Thalassospira alkalitolerans]
MIQLTGDMLRAAIFAGTELGKKARKSWKRGNSFLTIL